MEGDKQGIPGPLLFPSRGGGGGEESGGDQGGGGGWRASADTCVR